MCVSLFTFCLFVSVNIFAHDFVKNNPIYSKTKLTCVFHVLISALSTSGEICCGWSDGRTDGQTDDVRSRDRCRKLVVYTVSLAPMFVDVDQMSDHVTATTGSTEHISCSAVGQPVPQISWYKDGVPLTVDDHEEDLVIDDERNLIKATRQLVLRRLHRTDGGQYRCTASNVHGNVSFVYSLVVLGHGQW